MSSSHHDRRPYAEGALSDAVVTLRRGPLECRLHPELGARIGRLRRHDGARPFDYLAPLDPDGFDLARWKRAGCFAMLPYTNKLPDNTLEWRGEVVRVAAHREPAWLHGWGLRVPWLVVGAAPTHCTMAFAAVATAAWPWSYRAQLRVSLEPHGLDLSLKVTNCSTTSMPLGLGFHPYFSLRDDAQVTVEAAARWLASATSDGLPAVREALAAPLRLSLRRSELPDDTLTWFCETGRTKALIEYPDAERSITLVSDKAPFLVVHYRAGERFVCLEPSSHLPGRLDPAADAALPGESITMDMRLQLE